MMIFGLFIALVSISTPALAQPQILRAHSLRELSVDHQKKLAGAHLPILETASNSQAAELLDGVTDLVRQTWLPKDGTQPIKVILIDSGIPEAYYLSTNASERVLAISTGSFKFYPNDTQIKWLIGQAFEQSQSQVAKYFSSQEGVTSAKKYASYIANSISENEADIKSVITRIHQKGDDPYQAVEALKSLKAEFVKSGAEASELTKINSRIQSMEAALFAMKREWGEVVSTKKPTARLQQLTDRLLKSAGWETHAKASLESLIKEEPPEIQRLKSDLLDSTSPEGWWSRFYSEAEAGTEFRLRRILENHPVTPEEVLRLRDRLRLNFYEKMEQFVKQELVPKMSPRDLKTLEQMMVLRSTTGISNDALPEVVSNEIELRKQRQELQKSIARKDKAGAVDELKAESLEKEIEDARNKLERLEARGKELRARYPVGDDTEKLIDRLATHHVDRGDAALKSAEIEASIQKISSSEIGVGSIRKRIDLALNHRIQQSFNLVQLQDQFQFMDPDFHRSLFQRFTTRDLETMGPKLLQSMNRELALQLKAAPDEKAVERVLQARNDVLLFMNTFMDNKPYDSLSPGMKSVADQLMESQLIGMPYATTRNLEYLNNDLMPAGFKYPQDFQFRVAAAKVESASIRLKSLGLPKLVNEYDHIIDGLVKDPLAEDLLKSPKVREALTQATRHFRESLTSHLEAAGLAHPDQVADSLTSFFGSDLADVIPQEIHLETVRQRGLADLKVVAKNTGLSRSLQGKVNLGAVLDHFSGMESLEDHLLPLQNILNGEMDSRKIKSVAAASERITESTELAKRVFKKWPEQYRFAFELIDPKADFSGGHFRLLKGDNAKAARQVHHEKTWYAQWELFQSNHFPPKDFAEFLAEVYASGIKQGELTPALEAYLKNFSPRQQLELGRKLMAQVDSPKVLDLLEKTSHPRRVDRVFKNESLQKIMTSVIDPKDILRMAGSKATEEAAVDYLIKFHRMTYSPYTESVQPSEEALMRAFEDARDNPKLRKKFMDPELVSKLFSDHHKYELGISQLDHRYGVLKNASAFKDARFQKRAEVRKSIREAKELILKQFPKPSLVRDDMIETIEKTFRTSAAENAFLNDAKVNYENWYRTPLIGGIDVPAYANSHFPKLSLKSDLIDYMMSEKGKLADFAALDKHLGFEGQKLVSLKSYYAKAPVVARNYFLQPFVSSLIENPAYYQDLIKRAMGSHYADPIAREFFEAYLNALRPNDRPFVLGHVLAAHGIPGRPPGISITEILNAMPPFGIRAGQEIRANGLAKPEVLEDLKELYDGALKPTRAKQMKDLKELFGRNFDRVVVGDLLGSGSINYVVEVGLLDEHGKMIGKRAVRIQREGVEGKVLNENEVWERAILDRQMNSTNPDVKRIASTLDEVRLGNLETLSGSAHELDPAYDRLVHPGVEEAYATSKPHPKTGFKVEVARPISNVGDWIDPASKVKGDVYHFVEGTSILELEDGPLKKQLAAQILETELDAIFDTSREHPHAFDPDATPGQWKVDVDGKTLTRMDYSQFRRVKEESVHSMRKMLIAVHPKKLGRFEKGRILAAFNEVFSVSEAVDPKVLRQTVQKVLESPKFAGYQNEMHRIMGLRMDVESELLKTGVKDIKVRLKDEARAILKNVSRLNEYMKIIDDPEVVQKLFTAHMGTDLRTKIQYAPAFLKSRIDKLVQKCDFPGLLKGWIAGQRQ